MVRFFRSGFATQYIVIILAGVLLWGRSFFDPPSMPVPQGRVPLYDLVYLIFSSSPSVAVLIAFILMLFSAFYLNYMLSRHDIVTKNSSIAAFIFVILISYFPLILTLHPVTISIVFLLFILDNLFLAYRYSDPLDTTYSVGFTAALATLFYFPFIYFFILILITYILFRISNWRAWISSALGLLTPFLFLFVYYFWNDILKIRSVEYLRAFRLSFDINFFHNVHFMVFTVMIVILLLTGLFSGISHLKEKNIETRRKISSMIWVIPVVLFSLFFAGQYIQYHLMISFITVSTLLSLYLLRLKNSFWQEAALMAIFVVILLNNLFFIFT